MQREEVATTLNTPDWLVKFGVRPLKGVLPWIAGCGVVALGVLGYRAQQKLWKHDMLSRSQDRAN